MDFLTAFAEMSEMSDSFSRFSDSISLLVFIFGFLPLCGPLILSIASKWQIFEKAGLDGWAAMVPFYGRYCFYDITWDNGWVSLASYVPGIGYVLNVITMVKLSCRFEKNSVFTLGLVLFEPIFLAILGFDDSEFCD